RISLDRGAIGLGKQGVEAAVLVKDAEHALELDGRDLAGVIAEDAHGTKAVVAYDPLFVPFADLRLLSRPLGPALQAAQTDLPDPGAAGCSPGGVEERLAKHSPRDVVGHVAATNNDHPPPERDRPGQGDVTQEVHAAQHSRPVHAG